MKVEEILTMQEERTETFIVRFELNTEILSRLQKKKSATFIK